MNFKQFVSFLYFLFAHYTKRCFDTQYLQHFWIFKGQVMAGIDYSYFMQPDAVVKLNQ
jgi:hypothetical protein